MQILKLFFFLVLTLYLPNAMALEEKKININSIELNITNNILKKITNEELKLLEKQIINNQKFTNNYINKLTINLLLKKNSDEVSFSNGSAYDCHINLSYKNLKKPVLLLDIETDILFTLLHETAHCILTKDIMYQPIDWINVSNNQAFILQNIINKQEAKYLNDRIKVPPMLIYHEIFADTFAAIVLKNNNPQTFYLHLNHLIKMRKNKVHDKEESHLSVDALKVVQELNIKKDKLKIEDIYAISINIAQNAFIKYLNQQ